MPAEVAARAFEPFFTTKGLGKGSGLGLSMVYGLMKQSHGHAAIYSEIGRGTTVRLYLPQAAAAAGAPASTEPAPVPQGRQETVLVVEDDPDVRELAVTLVESLGYRSLAAADAGQALKWLAERPDIVLLFTDIVLPGGMNGVELAQEARRCRPQLKILFTSGYTEHALVQQGCLPAGAAMLAKPYRRAGLAEKFRAVLETAPAADDASTTNQG
jgi:CheY-like chemotaxis protein